MDFVLRMMNFVFKNDGFYRWSGSAVDRALDR